MLGKLHFSSTHSDERRLRDSTTMMKEAIDDNVAGDAASRTALNKAFGAACKSLGDPEDVNDMTLRTEALSIVDEHAESGGPTHEAGTETETSEAETLPDSSVLSRPSTQED